MKKLLLILSVALLLQACSSTPILNKNQYVITDTLDINRNALGGIIYYKVIISIDSVYHYGMIDNDGVLTYVSSHPLKLTYKK